MFRGKRYWKRQFDIVMITNGQFALRCAALENRIAELEDDTYLRDIISMRDRDMAIQADRIAELEEAALVNKRVLHIISDIFRSVITRREARIAELEAQLFEFAKYLDHTTGSRISKTNYTFETMLGVFDEHLNDLIKYAIEDIAEQNES